MCCVYSMTCTCTCMKSLCIVVSPERTGGATVKELSSPDGEWEGRRRKEGESYIDHIGGRVLEQGWMVHVCT